MAALEGRQQAEIKRAHRGRAPPSLLNTFTTVEETTAHPSSTMPERKVERCCRVQNPILTQARGINLVFGERDISGTTTIDDILSDDDESLRLRFSVFIQMIDRPRCSQ